MSGLGFSLQKRPDKRPLAGAKIAMPKKPATVTDMFGPAGSDDEHDDGNAKKARTERASASADQLAARLDADMVGVATKLADFVAKNGRQFEDMTRERNPGDSPFKFLHDKSSPGYQFYAAKLREFEAARGSNPPPAPPAAPPAPSSSNRGTSQPSTSGTGYPRQPTSSSSQPSSSLPPEAAAAVAAAAAAAAAARARSQPPPPTPALPSHPHPYRGSPAPQLAPQPLTAEQLVEARRRAQIALAKGDSLAAMEAFAAMAAKRDRARSSSADPEDPDGSGGGSDDEEGRRRRAEPLLNKTAFERRKVVAVYKDDGTRGHHMQDYIPKEVLAEFMAKAGDKIAAVQAEQLANKNAIGADNIGHKLLQKMGWKEGEGLGGSQKGITAPIRAAAAAPAAGEARGLGAEAHGEVKADDDMFEAYRKRMMLGYKYRPNPLGNPRRAYY
ncbi:hypothetical protein PLESTB_000023500 [Pleodorina starrii]|uniref:SURP and G-patch domain-containing protein 1-like protein n=1 Tax=Pleodorina starrii TaxID=330485 RepID=A0A9W6B9Y4_9CHLO|nr:hypothetical protein PLESTM_001111300 [Pleodorina starrii]GLC47767.1 hypothetical protein PLESTB_000023500 [Pleodorina starrii]GLC70820.1 hypothetical protein PLESTF_001036500 [Pleodorina starrii]